MLNTGFWNVFCVHYLIVERQKLWFHLTIIRGLIGGCFHKSCIYVHVYLLIVFLFSCKYVLCKYLCSWLSFHWLVAVSTQRGCHVASASFMFSGSVMAGKHRNLLETLEWSARGETIEVAPRCSVRKDGGSHWCCIQGGVGRTAVSKQNRYHFSLWKSR